MAGLTPLLRRFNGALPCLQLIARANGIADPFDALVVDAYWVGNPLLDTVEVRQLVLGKAPAGARPDHSFHVLDVHSRVGELEHSLHTLDSCRVSWSQIVAVDGAELLVDRQPLLLEFDKLV